MIVRYGFEFDLCIRPGSDLNQYSPIRFFLTSTQSKIVQTMPVSDILGELVKRSDLHAL